MLVVGVPRAYYALALVPCLNDCGRVVNREVGQELLATVPLGGGASLMPAASRPTEDDQPWTISHAEEVARSVVPVLLARHRAPDLPYRGIPAAVGLARTKSGVKVGNDHD